MLEFLFWYPTGVYISQLIDKCNPKLCNKNYQLKNKDYIMSQLSPFLVPSETWRFLHSSMNNFNVDIQVMAFLHYLHLSCSSCNALFKAYILEGEDNTCWETYLFLASLFFLFLWQCYNSGQPSLSCPINRSKLPYGESADELFLIPLLI